MDGSQITCTYIAEISESGTLPHGKAAWIKSQRASLARILAQRERALESPENGLVSYGKFFEQLTLFDLPSCSSKTPPSSAHGAAAKSSQPFWREDIPTETERLQPLMSGLRISDEDGGCLLPTLRTNDRGCYRDKAALKRRFGTNLWTALKFLPTLCTMDYDKPRPLESYRKRTQKGFKQLRDTLAHEHGFPISAEIAEWFMGWPIGFTRARKQG